MTPDERDEKFRLQTDGLYAGLGRFAVNFEQLVDAMRQVIKMHVSSVPAPFHLRQQKVADIFTSDLTADPLVRTFRSILLLTLENYKRQEQRIELEKMLSNICSRIESVNTERNKFLHGTWFINYASEDQEDFSLARGLKAKNTDKGLRIDTMEHTVESFLEASEERQVLTDLLRGFGLCMLSEIDILKNYAFSEKKLVRIYS